jgi:exodeoxyribonuclease V alpha subunit
VNASHTLRVATIRKQNPRGFGGAIFTGKPIDRAGNVTDAAQYFVVRASGAVLSGAQVQVGQWWVVSGEVNTRAAEVNGFRILEQQVEASSATLLRVSGAHVVTFIAESEKFEGIGHVKAQRLWDTFGERLYDILDQGDIATLSTVLTDQVASQAVVAWKSDADTRSLQWLHEQGFDVALGRKLLAFFGRAASTRIEEDPYRLLSFCASWNTVDTIARSRFGLACDDPRRLQGAVEEACYRLFADGHTAVALATLTEALTVMLGAEGERCGLLGIIQKALDQGESNGAYVIGAQDVQPLGALVMESMIARGVVDRMTLGASAALLSVRAIDAILSAHEALEGITLTDEQRKAVHTVCTEAFACITGGAGVGKTTVLKALYEVYDRVGLKVVQVALAGRAAKRMQEATGRRATTIATFLKSYQDGDLASPAVLVVDEASMVDVIAMSRICDTIPSHVRLVLVGDPNQLMPVGPGLVLHAVTTVPSAPNVQLNVVKRYGDDIRRAATAICGGQWPTLGDDPTAAIAFLPCETDRPSIAESVFDLYAQDAINTQILSPRRSGSGGTTELNTICQARLTRDRTALTAWNAENDRLERTGIHLGDIVLCTRNLWDRGLQNGSLGTVVEIADEPSVLTDDEVDDAGYALGWVDWDDGVRRPIVENMLDDLELGYAITVHKAQGSQWPRVIVPVTRSRLLDRTLLYTAVTRAQRQVLLVGDEAAARDAVVCLPRAQTRQVALQRTLANLLHPPAHGPGR